MLKSSKLVGVAASAILISTASVTAATISIADITETYMLPSPSATSGSVNEGVTGSIDGVYRDPYEGTLFAGTEYTSVQANSSATYEDLSTKFSTLNIIWGSVDTYNFIDFYYGNTFIETVGGGDLIPPAPKGVGGVIASIMPGSYFNRIILRSETKNAFEYGGIRVTEVPLPAGILLLGGALAGLGIVRRRKS